jgi:hypothetical protein
MDTDTRDGFVVATSKGREGRRPLRLGLGVALGLGLLQGAVIGRGRWGCVGGKAAHFPPPILLRKHRDVDRFLKCEQSWLTKKSFLNAD